MGEQYGLNQLHAVAGRDSDTDLSALQLPQELLRSVLERNRQILFPGHGEPRLLDLLNGKRKRKALPEIRGSFPKTLSLQTFLQILRHFIPESSEKFHVDLRPDPHGRDQRSVQIKDHGAHLREQLIQRMAPAWFPAVLQFAYLLRRKRPERSAGKVFRQAKAAHGKALQIDNLFSHSLEHPLHLVESSLPDHERDLTLLIGRENRQLCGKRRLFISDIHSLRELHGILLCHSAADSCKILLVHVLSG